jgi:hypothetical protein
VLPALTKPLESLTAADLQDLTSRQWPESENVEYKSGLSRGQNNQQDPWYNGGKLSSQSKEKIFKELVAFANTSGGRLFLGVTETSARPPCAEAIQPVPRCCELAERLEQSIVSSIDPPLNFFRLVGVPIEGDSGVVIAEVSASYNGPHRSPDLQCYVRKGTNSVPVGMREIHDIVMRLSRRQDEIRLRLSERQEKFREWVGVGQAFQNLRVGFRVTAVPVGAPIYLEKVFNNREISRGFHGVNGTWTRSPTNSITDDFPSPVRLSERPTLGGTVWLTSPASELAGQKLILRDGLIDLWFRDPWHPLENSPDPRPRLNLAWIVAAAANVIASADAFRQATQTPACEYGIQLELLATNGPAEIAVELMVLNKRWGLFELLGSPVASPARVGPYSIGDRDAVMNLIVRDLLDGSAVTADWPKLEIDWASAHA